MQFESIHVGADELSRVITEITKTSKYNRRMARSLALLVGVTPTTSTKVHSHWRCLHVSSLITISLGLPLLTPRNSNPSNKAARPRDFPATTATGRRFEGNDFVTLVAGNQRSLIFANNIRMIAWASEWRRPNWSHRRAWPKVVCKFLWNLRCWARTHCGVSFLRRILQQNYSEADVI